MREITVYSSDAAWRHSRSPLWLRISIHADPDDVRRAYRQRRRAGEGTNSARLAVVAIHAADWRAL